MIQDSNTFSRLVRWGLSLTVGIVAMLFLLRTAYTEYLSANWESIQIERENDLSASIQNKFRQRLNDMTARAAALSKDSALLNSLISDKADVIHRAFNRLRSIELESGYGVEVVDANGSLVGWSGVRDLPESGRQIAMVEDTTVTMTAGSLRTLVSVAVRAGSMGLTAITSYPFDVNRSVSSRFVDPVGFCNDIEESIGTKVGVIGGGHDDGRMDGRRRRIELTDFGGTPLVAIVVNPLTLESELQEVEFFADAAAGAVVSLGTTFLMLLLVQYGGRKASSGVRLLAALAGVWIVRFVWLWMSFPSSVLRGWLFDPGYYASQFGGGLASSLGELTISMGALFLSGLLIARSMESMQIKMLRPGNGGSARFAGIVIVAMLGLAIVLRSYGAVIRSFVYDSTLTFINPAEVVPSVEVILMYVNILAVTFTLLIVFAIVVDTCARHFSSTGSAYSLRTLVAVGSLYGLAMVVFDAFDRIPQVPWYSPILLFVLILILLKIAHVNGRGVVPFLGTPVGMLVGTIMAFVVSSPVLDMKIHEKEDDRLRLYATEMAQPVDSWLSFLTNESYRVVSESYRDVAAAFQEEPVSSSIAFPLWARTLMSREGYNSTLVIYDQSGREVDRFAVGMTGYEQTQLLERLFEVDEEILNVVERRVPEGLIKYYGIWGSILDTADTAVAYAALILSASERALFRGENLAPLRPFAALRFSQVYHSVNVSEYQDGRLVASTDVHRRKGSLLPGDIMDSMTADAAPYIQYREDIAGTTYETLVIRDASRPGRMIAISLEEVGLRWHLFNLVKVGTLYALILLVASGVLLIARWNQYRGFLMGFRGRLVLAFLTIAIVPLILFGFYNREFAEERQAVNVTNRLNSDLDLVNQRIVASIVGDDDLEYGLTDDFCESVAAEYGIDFSVYRRTEVAASSRPELYSSGLLNPRLPGEAFAEILVAGHGYAQTWESIGNVTYAVGFRPLEVNGRIVGVLAVPALYRQSELEAEVAERNAFTLAVYGVLIFLTAVMGVVIANQLSQPVRKLTGAAHAVGSGDLNVRVPPQGGGEIQVLIETFNEMVAELRKSREELRQVERERAWKEMAKQVAHEIKNPLTPMRLSIQHLRIAYKDKAPEFDKLIDDVAQTLIGQIDALSRIATEFSSFARMPERRFERVSLHALLDESISLFAAVDGIEIHKQFSTEDPVLIADREELRRVVINIIRNAIQAMDQRGTVTMKTTVEGRRCTMEISDTGPGIPKDLQEKVFEPNFSTKTDGMGLGLAMARNIIEDLNGVIGLRSAPGKGTTIILELPIVSRGETE